MRITRSTLRRLIAEESARLLREAAEEEVTTTNEAERGKKRKKRGGADCLYVLFGGRGAYFYTAPCGLTEDEAAATGNNVTDDVVGGEDDMASSLELYDWLGRHDEITAVYDLESAGGEVSKDDYMAQLEDVARQDGLLADEEFVNEEADEPLDETEDQHYNDDMQSRLGRFTTPENVKGTPQHKDKHAPSAGGGRGGSGYVSRRSEWGDADLYGGPPRVDEGRDGDVDCLYILKRGGQHVYIVARPYIDNAEELAEVGNDITDMIMAQGPAARDANVYEFLSSNPGCAVVRVRGAYEMADDYMMTLEDNLGVSTGPVFEGAFPEELEGIYGEEPPEFDETDEDPNYFSDEFEDSSEDPDYFDTDYDDESASDDWMDIETGEDDVPYGAADVALRQGRGHRTDEGDDLYEGDSQGDDDMGYEDYADYEHAYAMGGGSDEEGFAIDYDTGRPSPFAAKMFGQPAAGADDIEGADADEDVWGDDDMGRRGARDDYHHALKLGGGRDEDGFAADYDTGKKRQFPPARGGLSEARWAKLAGILKD